MFASIKRSLSSSSVKYALFGGPMKGLSRPRQGSVERTLTGAEVICDDWELSLPGEGGESNLGSFLNLFLRRSLGAFHRFFFTHFLVLGQLKAIV